MIEPLTKERPETLHPHEESASVYVYRDVLEELRFNAIYEPTELACGLLAGKHFKCPDDLGTFVEVEGFFGGRHVPDLASFLRELRKSWDDVRPNLLADFPSSELVGWYVALPRDDAPPDSDALVVHNTFFNHPWQLGLWIPGQRGTTLSLRSDVDGLNVEPVHVIRP